MLLAALSASPEAVLVVVAGWIAVTIGVWRAAITAYERLAGCSKANTDPSCPLVLAAGISLTLGLLLCVRSGMLQTAAEIFGAFACAAPLLQIWLDARELPKPRRPRALPPMDDAIGGSRSY
jgi:hypothetical protein